MKIEKRGEFFKVDDTAKVAYGWAIVCTDGGKPYVDLQGDHIPEDVMLDAATEFAENSRVAKDMHAGDQVGEFPFIYPFTSKSKDLGIDSTRTGLLVGFKPADPAMLDLIKQGKRTGFSIGGVLTDSEETAKVAKSADGKKTYRTFRAFKIHEISLVDVPAQEGATVGYVKRAVLVRKDAEPVAKEAVLTSTDDGHAHTVSLDDPSRYWCDQLQTSYQTSEGADTGHSHAWVFDPKSGAITIADDSGHSHTIAAVVPSDVLAVYAAREAQRDAQNLAEAAAPALIADDPSDGVPMAVAVEESSGSARVVVINARAPQSKSTRAPAVQQAGSYTKEPIMANEHDAKIADLTKRNERLERIAKLNGAHKAHFDTLTAEDAETFLAKSAKDRDSEIAEIEKGNAPIWTGEVTGVAVRKSDGALALQLAKQNEANAVALAKREAEIEKAEVRAQASEILKGMPGDDATHDLIVRSLRKSGAKAEDIEKAFATLKGMRDTSKIGKAAPGVGGEATDGEPIAKFNSKLTEFAKAANKTTVQAFEAFCNTPEGAELYAASRRIQA